MEVLCFFLLFFLTFAVNAAECPFSGIHENDFLEILEDFPQKDKTLKTLVESLPYLNNFQLLSKDLIKTIKKELHLTPYHLNNLVFVVDDTLQSYFNMSAYTQFNTVILKKLSFFYLQKGVDGTPFSYNSFQEKCDVEVPSALALRIFLAMCQHEITHIQKRHHEFLDKTSILKEYEADQGILPKHLRAMFVNHIINDIKICHHEGNLMLLKEHDNFQNVDSKQLFKSRSHEAFFVLNHSQGKNSHPSHRERAQTALQRAREFEQTEAGKKSLQKHPVSYECATIKLFKELSGLEQLMQKSNLFRTFQVCESGTVTITDHNSGKTEIFEF